MADPVSLGLTLGMTALSTGLSLYGAKQQAQAEVNAGQAEWAKAQYLSGVAQVNKKIDLQNADYEKEMGEVEAQRAGIAGQQLMGEIKAGQAANGLDLNLGSNVQVRQSQQGAIDRDQDMIRHNAARRAYGHELEALSEEQSSTLYKFGGDNAVEAAKLKSQSSMISAAAGVASKWSSAYTSGMFGGTKAATTGPNSLGGNLTSLAYG